MKPSLREIKSLYKERHSQSVQVHHSKRVVGAIYISSLDEVFISPFLDGEWKILKMGKTIKHFDYGKACGLTVHYMIIAPNTV